MSREISNFNVMRKYLLFALIIVNGVFALNAQTKSELQLGLVMPKGDFADDDLDYAITEGSGGARTGLYLGYKLLTPIKTNGLFWTLNAGIMYNDLQKNFKDDLEDYWDSNDFHTPKYINVPILAGLQYELMISEDFKLFGEAGLGLNILKLTNFSASEGNYKMTTIFKPSASLGFKIGAGVVIQDKYTIALNYMGLGSHKVNYRIEEKDGGETYKEDDKFDEALSISTLNITLGIRF